MGTQARRDQMSRETNLPLQKGFLICASFRLGCLRDKANIRNLTRSGKQPINNKSSIACSLHFGIALAPCTQCSTVNKSETCNQKPPVERIPIPLASTPSHLSPRYPEARNHSSPSAALPRELSSSSLPSPVTINNCQGSKHEGMHTKP